MTKTQSVVLRLVFCLSIFLGVFLGAAFSQNAPNCNQQNFIMTAAGTVTQNGQTTNFNATSAKCVAWTFSYFSEGFSGVSIQIESAPDNAGVPGAFTIIPSANIAIGTNPLTATTFGTMTISGYFPWVRVNLTTATGTGVVNYTLVGNSYVGPASNTLASTGAAATTVKAIGPDAPGVAPTQNPVQIGGFDGTLVRRILTDTLGDVHVTNQGFTGADAVPNGNLSNLGNSGVANLLTISPFLYDGATQWNRQRSAGVNSMPVSTTLTGRNSIGAQLQEKGSRGVVVSNPAAGSQATASVAAAAAVSHVLDCVSFSASSVVAPALTALTINARDGATGAGTIIWTYTVAITAATGQNVVPHSICGLNLVGTANTAMTVEFSAGLASLSEAVSMTFFNIN